MTGSDSLHRHLMATRPGFLAASALPVLTGSSVGAWLAAALDPMPVLLALLGMVSLHAALNIINDLCDDIHGSDRINTASIPPYTGGSRFLQEGLLTRAQLVRWALLLLLAALLCGVVLIWLRGLPVLWLGMAGLVLGIAYSAPPLALAARGLGEPAVGLAFGLLPVTAAAWLQTGRLEPAALLLAWPVTAWATSILLVNEVPDAAADAAVGKRTLAVRLGIPGQRRLYLALQLSAPVPLLAAPTLGLSPWILSLPLVLALAGLWAGQRIAGGRAALRHAIRSTLAIHTVGCLWLALAPWLVPSPAN